MARSASDATRFTATAPHAYSKASSSSSSTSTGALRWPPPPSSAPRPGQPGGGGVQETARAKVERLRAEVRAKRIAESTSAVDRIILRGRVWADRLHRVVAYSLIAVSGVAGVVTVYSFGSLILHNRRQRALWIDSELKRLLEAKKAYVGGTATAEQIELLQKEKRAEEEARQREEMKKQTAFFRARNYLFGTSAETSSSSSSSSTSSTNSSSTGESRILEEVRGNVENAPVSAVLAAGSQLEQDRQAEAAARAASAGEDGRSTQSKRSWRSWIGGS